MLLIGTTRFFIQTRCIYMNTFTLHKKMMIRFLFIIACVLLALTMTLSCLTKNDKHIASPIRMLSSCYLENNLYSAIMKETYILNEEGYDYLTELCTANHRLVILQSHDMSLSKSLFDRIMEDIVPLVNEKVRMFAHTKMSNKNILRLQRCLLEDAFYEMYNKSMEKARFVSFERDRIVYSPNIEKMLERLPKHYDDALIKYHITQNEEGLRLIYIGI